MAALRPDDPPAPARPATRTIAELRQAAAVEGIGLDEELRIEAALKASYAGGTGRRPRHVHVPPAPAPAAADRELPARRH